MIALTGHDQTVADWVGKKLSKPFVPPFTAIGWIDQFGALKAGAVFNDYNGSNIEVTIYGPKVMTRGMLRQGFYYAFTQLKANRLTARTERKNKRMRKILHKMGFVFEGVAARYFGPHKRNDALVFRMLRNDAERWLQMSPQVSPRLISDTVAK